MYIIIPVRYGSTRLPAKALEDIKGKRLIQHVYERALEAAQASAIVIATDDDRIKTAAETFGARVVMTSKEHRSGTERISEVIRMLEIKSDEIIVNLQGDEPLMRPELIRQVANILQNNAEAAVATICHRISKPEQFEDPNVVKVVLDKDGYALYFSRAKIPWPRKLPQGVFVDAYRHIGLYAYRAGFVSEYVSWARCPIEEIEELEQLRVLWHGYRIVVDKCEEDLAPEVSVDTPMDLERARQLILSYRTSSPSRKT